MSICKQKLCCKDCVDYDVCSIVCFGSNEICEFFVKRYERKNTVYPISMLVNEILTKITTHQDQIS
jgi:hypothetical protein